MAIIGTMFDAFDVAASHILIHAASHAAPNERNTHMARSAEMKLHYAIRAINGRNHSIESFYDTHIRLWTAYIRDEDGSAGPCSYATSKRDAIDNCVSDATD